MAKMKAGVVAENVNGESLGRGVQPIGETHVVFVRYPGGAIGRISQTGPVVDLTAGGVQITQEEYEAELADVQLHRAAVREGHAMADRANTLSDYRELRAAGVSDAGARRMSGFTGETPEELA